MEAKNNKFLTFTVQRVGHNFLIPPIHGSPISFLICSNNAVLFGDFLMSFISSFAKDSASLSIWQPFMESPLARLVLCPPQWVNKALGSSSKNFLATPPK